MTPETPAQRSPVPAPLWSSSVVGRVYRAPNRYGFAPAPHRCGGKSIHPVLLLYSVPMLVDLPVSQKVPEIKELLPQSHARTESAAGIFANG
jgi:hypothetical protein